MFSFEEYFRNPYKGEYALKIIFEDSDCTSFRLCDGSIIHLHRSVDRDLGWFVDDTRQSNFKAKRYYKTYSRGLSRVELLNAKVIEKILACA